MSKKSKKIIFLVLTLVLNTSFSTYADVRNINTETSIQSQNKKNKMDLITRKKIKFKSENKKMKTNIEKNIKNETEIKAVKEKNIENKMEEKDGFVYIKEINMLEDHQKYLYGLCKERDLDYLKMIAIIALESNFNPSLISRTNDYGYMQVNIVNHKRMVETLKTENKPLDPYTNLNWGTYLLKELYDIWKDKNISDEIKEGEVFSQLDKHVMSSYNRGLTGFKRNGIATRYISLTRDRYIKLEQGICN